MIEQELVEFGASDLIGAVATRTKTVFEIKLRAFGSASRDNFAAEFRQKCAVKFFAQAQAIECLCAKRQERFADVKAWKFFALENDHAPPGARQQRGCSATSRPAADDSDVVDVDLHYG